MKVGIATTECGQGGHRRGRVNLSDGVGTRESRYEQSGVVAYMFTKGWWVVA